eukprot:GFKZ01008006.1.p1 GENE.GFKZ01008006.1~~GFKZ01008006.1.p1  ORF type:complete len:980 (-),score=160.59 GFKZ01008006.1:1342-4281(-)
MPPQTSPSPVRCREAKEARVSVLKRPRVGLPPDMSDTLVSKHDVHRSSSDACSKLNGSLSSHHSQFAVQKRLQDLQKRLGNVSKGTTGVIPKRKRGADTRPTAVSLANSIASASSKKRESDLSGGNGRVGPWSERKGPTTLWERLAAARKRLMAEKRVDPRFVSGRRPLDCVDGLRTTFCLTLFADGYAKHDVADTGKPGANNESGPIVKYPYDRNSRDFLRCLDLGLIPPEEDLPDIAKRFYYDGCLVAEVRDWRLGNRDATGVKILLRPDMASLYEDIEALTQNVDSSVAMAVEQKILKAISGPIDCSPADKKGRGAGTEVLDGSTASLTYAFNVGRRPKRRRVARPSLSHSQPKVSTAALLLISESEKQQTLHWYAQQSAKPVSKGHESNAQKQGGAGGIRQHAASSRTNVLSRSADIAVRPKNSLMDNGISTSKNAANATKPEVRPPPMLLNLHQGEGMLCAGKPAPNTASARASPERLRTVRLILPDQGTGEAYERARKQMEAAKARDSQEAVQAAQAAHQKALGTINQPGRQMYVLEMIRTSARGIELVVYRGLFGDKIRDMFRVQLPDEQQGNAFLNQYKAITSKEGYVCLQDVTAAENLAHQRQQQMKALQQQNQGSAGTSKQQKDPKTQATGQKQASSQQKVAPVSRPGQSLPQGTSTQQQLLQAQQKKQMELQRQQELQRQRHQQNAQIPLTAQRRLQQLSSLPQQAQHANAVRSTQQVPLQQAAQQPLQQTQHPAQITLQHHPQLFRQQMPHPQQLQQLQQYQNAERARRLQQFQRNEKNAGNLQQVSAGILGPTGRGGQVLSKGGPGIQGNLIGMPRGGVTTALNSSAMGSLGSAGLLGRNQLFTQSHMQHIQQFQQTQQQQQQQQLRAQEQHRSLLAAAAVGGAHGNGQFPRNGNIPTDGTMSAQHLQTQALAAVMGSDALGITGSTAALTGADALTQQQIRQHLKQQQQQKQRENLETESRGGKR